MPHPELDPDYAATLGETLFLGESQVTLMEVPGSVNEVYFVNFITRRESRKRGEGQRMFLALLALADESGVTLVTHPDTDEIQHGLAKSGFVVVEGRRWEGKVLMARVPFAPIPERCPITDQSMDDIPVTE